MDPADEQFLDANWPNEWKIGGTMRSDNKDTSTISCYCGQTRVWSVADEGFVAWFRKHAPHMKGANAQTQTQGQVFDFRQLDACNDEMQMVVRAFKSLVNSPSETVLYLAMENMQRKYEALAFQARKAALEMAATPRGTDECAKAWVCSKCGKSRTRTDGRPTHDFLCQACEGPLWSPCKKCGATFDYSPDKNWRAGLIPNDVLCGVCAQIAKVVSSGDLFEREDGEVVQITGTGAGKDELSYAHVNTPLGEPQLTGLIALERLEKDWRRVSQKEYQESLKK